MRSVRVAAKAVIIQDGKLLVTENVDDDGHWYILPGGGQEHGETLPQALRRECREELGVEVDVGELLYVRDYIGRHHEYAATDGEEHALELMFACTVRPGQVPGNGTNPDQRQVGVAWLPVAELDGYRLYPKVLRALIAELARAGRPEDVYLGDVN
ncbi:MAG TPA: NUDIX domain-containing protein [Chloroflexota bacterium]|jgi:8-oxo-dGTP diphosphatase|nr:NUDIX domain-containing protein [Chloroflexota bacterium]HEX2184605.1 NUDIX domain-containing protein [Chloroflexota bacterium]